MTDLLWLLLGAQIVMGAADTLYHHELTERLAWRRSQAHELQLHGVRNLFYSVIFLLLGFSIFHGLIALAVLVALYAELLVTLKDFVEEDRTRKLPASERVLHTLLALNYGAILMGITPVLLERAAQPTGIGFATYGFWSLACLAAGLGTIVFGLRDLGASARLKRMAIVPAASLLDPVITPRRVLVTGGTGFIGSRLVAALVARGDHVTVLTRNAASAGHLPAPLRIVTDLDQIRVDERIDAIVNLAGQATAGGLWTGRYRRKLLRSRLQVTREVTRLIARLAHKPAVLVNGSAIGAYGARPKTILHERTSIEPDSSFSQRLCLTWENHARRAEALGVRTVLLRIGLVLDTEGGPLSQMLAPFEYGVGGPFGNGRQWMSWISRDDLVRLIDHAMRDKDISGPLNGVAPEAVTNGDFVRALGSALHRPALIPIPAFLLSAGLGDLGREIFLGSQQVRPNLALQSGFRFRDVRLGPCLKRLVGTPAANAPDSLQNAPAMVSVTVRPVVDARSSDPENTPGGMRLGVKN